MWGRLINVLIWKIFAGRMGIVDHDVVELNNLQRQVKGEIGIQNLVYISGKVTGFNVLEIRCFGETVIFQF